MLKKILYDYSHYERTRIFNQNEERDKFYILDNGEAVMLNYLKLENRRRYLRIWKEGYYEKITLLKN